ncbi:MAG TPA: DNA alkylation response protein, partial [Actinomycetota bacterium]
MSVAERRHGTHDVLNQPPPLEGHNLFEQDAVLSEAVQREGGGWGLDRLRAFGGMIGTEALRLGVLADRNPPVLKTHDRYGHR